MVKGQFSNVVEWFRDGGGILYEICPVCKGEGRVKVITLPRLDRSLIHGIFFKNTSTPPLPKESNDDTAVKICIYCNEAGKLKSNPITADLQRIYQQSWASYISSKTLFYKPNFKPFFIFLLGVTLLYGCAVTKNRGYQDTHGHRMKYLEAQKDKRRAKMLKKKGYFKNVFKSGDGGYDKNQY